MFEEWMNSWTNLNVFSFELFSLTYRRVRSSFFLALRLHIFVLNCSVFIVNSATPLRHLCRPAIKRKVCRFCFDRSRVINFDHHSWLTGAISRSAPRPVSWGDGEARRYYSSPPHQEDEKDEKVTHWTYNAPSPLFAERSGSERTWNLLGCLAGDMTS